MQQAELDFQEAVRASLNLPVGPDAPRPADVDKRLDELRIATQGQRSPFPLDGSGRMTARNSALRLDALELVVNGLLAAFSDQSVELQLVAAQAKASLANDQANAAAAIQAQATADQAKAAADAAAAKAEAVRLANLATDAKAVAAQSKADQAKAEADANQAAITALAAGTAQAQATADQARVDAAKAQQKADNDQLLAQAAQATADQAKATADQAKADAAAAKATATQATTNAAAAQTSADQAKAAVATLAANTRSVRIPTPAMAVLQSATVNVTWPTPFADASYNSWIEWVGSSLLGIPSNIVSWTAQGCVVQFKNTLGVALVAGQGTLQVNARHD